MEKERFCRNPPISAVHSFILANFATKEVNSRTPNSEDLWRSLSILLQVHVIQEPHKANQVSYVRRGNCHDISEGQYLPAKSISTLTTRQEPMQAAVWVLQKRNASRCKQMQCKCNDRSQTQRLVQLLSSHSMRGLLAWTDRHSITFVRQAPWEILKAIPKLPALDSTRGERPKCKGDTKHDWGLRILYPNCGLE